ncbi:MAG TPA: extradiol ring-cleavage dioxygenase [Alphaproteobacteria bacterium]|nr:extradiol ring-cleavage dioxygenase [Alphaproteobacteria bacterium]
MSGGIIRAGVAPHTPRMGIEEKAPVFVKELIKGSYAMGEAIRATKPDVIVVNSSHWVCTFNWYVTCQAEHKGRCVADEAPDLIPGVPYRYKGDRVYAGALVDEIRALGYPCNRNECEHFSWDYGSWVPAHYLDPRAEIPIVLVGTVVSADLKEAMAVGTAVKRAAEKTGRNVVFIASCSFTHKLVRGPELWPTEARQALDRKFIAMITDGRIAEAKAWFPDYTSEVVGEMGGRNIATMLGCLDDDRRYTGMQYGPYGQSSGSGNANVLLQPVH